MCMSINICIVNSSKFRLTQYIFYLMEVCFRPHVKGEDTYSVGPRVIEVSSLEDTQLSRCLPPTPEDGNIQFPKRYVFYFLEYRTVGEVQKPNNSECFTVLYEGRP
jgi:hypothetical protein